MEIDLALVEVLSAASHDGWMEAKREQAKDLDRYNVRSTLKAIDRAGYKLVQKES